MTKYLEVGDTLVVESFMGKGYFPITRVTKTLAFSKRESDGYEHSFKREIGYNMSHPRQKWDTLKYTVIFNEK